MVAMAVVGTPATAVWAKEIYRAESTVLISDDPYGSRTTNRMFEIIYHPEQKSRLLLQKEIIEGYQDGEPGAGQVRIDAWRLPRSPKTKPVFSITQDGSEIGWFSYPSILTIRIRACCASSGSFAAVSAASGKTLAYANARGDAHESFATVERLGTLNVLIGVIDVHSGRQPAVFPEDRKKRPVLVTVADGTSCRRQLLFTFPAQATGLYMSSVRWDRPKAGKVSDMRIDLAQHDQLEATLRITMSDGQTIVLPVSDEGIVPSKVPPVSGASMMDVSPCRLQ